MIHSNDVFKKTTQELTLCLNFLVFDSQKRFIQREVFWICMPQEGFNTDLQIFYSIYTISFWLFFNDLRRCFAFNDSALMVFKQSTAIFLLSNAAILIFLKWTIAMFSLTTICFDGSKHTNFLLSYRISILWKWSFLHVQTSQWNNIYITLWDSDKLFLSHDENKNTVQG